MTGGRSEIRTGARAVSPYLFAIAVAGVLFGSLAVAAGLPPLAAVVMSATTFAGSAQFAAIAVFGAGGSLGAAASASALLNARYLAINVPLAPALPASRWKRVLLAQLAVDESWAIAYRGDGQFSRGRLIGAGLMLYLTHVTATALGVVAGGMIIRSIPPVVASAALVALFTMLLRPLLSERESYFAAGVGAVTALVLIPLTPPGVPLIGAALTAFVPWNSR